MQPYTPIGTLYAATALRRSAISVAVFDTMLEAPEEKFHALLEQHPQIVVVYEDDFNFLSKMCLTRMREVAFAIAKQARTVGAVVVVHGSDSTDNPELFLNAGFDYVLCGEAEEVLVKLCSSVLRGEEPLGLDGMLSLAADGTLVQASRRLAKNSTWADLALPARDLIDLGPYRDAWHAAHGYFSTNMVASRGCPFRCNWCAKPISGNQFQLRPASIVAEEMLLLKRAGVEHIWFGDDVFALDHRWVADFAQEVTKRDAAIPFKVQSRADLMREDTVLHLKQAGCAEIWMGVESGSQEILDSMDKGLKLSSVLTACDRLRDAGIRPSFFLQFGYPGETWTELQETIAFVRKARPHDIGISFSYPLPGTVFYERVRSQLGPKRNWTDSDDLCIMFKAAYTTDFYRAVREALHAEVDSWDTSGEDTSAAVEARWREVIELESVSRVPDSFTFTPSLDLGGQMAFVPVDTLTAGMS
jgi:anaerobic magnesium-protoporphyrin IX monomethyl ester cyclase